MSQCLVTAMASLLTKCKQRGLAGAATRRVRSQQHEHLPSHCLNAGYGDCRGQFAPQMINMLSKLGLPQNSSAENRRLAIDMASLIVQWEQRRLATPDAATRTSSTPIAVPQTVSRKRPREEIELTAMEITDAPSLSEHVSKQVGQASIAELANYKMLLELWQCRI